MGICLLPTSPIPNHRAWPHRWSFLQTIDSQNSRRSTTSTTFDTTYMTKNASIASATPTVHKHSCLVRWRERAQTGPQRQWTARSDTVRMGDVDVDGIKRG